MYFKKKFLEVSKLLKYEDSGIGSFCRTPVKQQGGWEDKCLLQIVKVEMDHNTLETNLL